MEQHISQEETRRIIISDMVKKRGTIVPIIGDDTIVYREKDSGEEIPFQEFVLREFQKKYPHVEVSDADIVSMKERGYYGLSLMSQYYERRFLDDFMDFVNDNRSCIKLKDEVLDFLVTFNFPIIITTMCFDIIEQQLKGKIGDYSRGLNLRFDDVVDIKKGRQQRQVSFDLPSNVRNEVELEIINCTNNDIECVVISN